MEEMLKKNKKKLVSYVTCRKCNEWFPDGECSVNWEKTGLEMVKNGSAVSRQNAEQREVHCFLFLGCSISVKITIKEHDKCGSVAIIGCTIQEIEHIGCQMMIGGVHISRKK